MIDDHEAEWLQPHQLPAAEKAIREWLLKWPGGASGLFLEKLLLLIGRAREMGRPLYFEC